MFCFQNVGKLFLHFLNIKKIVCESPFSGIVDGIVRGHKCGSLFRWLTKTWRSSWSCRITLQFNQKSVQFSLRWAVFIVAYNPKRGVSSFKLSPLVWFKVSSSPGCVHNAQTASWGWNWFDNFGEHFLQPTSSLQPKTFLCETGGETSLTQFSSV